ncbi:zinc finger protein 839 isoform X2 [Rhineura floridana]|uniref:zinc finger protein 839 isoform X2 n=1 Tax=Rhineura floridana TaxID=261503 RepID=UPI002AC84A38|nr:zinc finger protein 839 isoform X2 [Rhineura floridana]
MAGSEGKEAVAEVTGFGLEVPSSGTVVYPQINKKLPALAAELGCRELNQPLGAVTGKEPRKSMDEAPRPPLGKQERRAVAEISADQRIGEVAVLSQGNGASSPPAQDNGLLVSDAEIPVRGFSSATSASVSGPVAVSGILYTAAQQLQNVAQRVALQQGKSAAVVAPNRLPPPKLETICIQVQPEQTEAKERLQLSLAAVESNNVTVNQPLEKNSRILGLNLINPQVIQIQSVTGTGPDQFLLYNSSEPALQLLLQRPLHSLGQVSVGKITQGLFNRQKNKSVTVAAKDSRNNSACSVNSLINHEKKNKHHRVKKSLKVKTRSGRISRPPKYKAKDYKFIKTEDLADCHQSGSDDYSELSVEDDGDKEKEVCSLFGPLNYDLKPKLFKCQSCKKSYIGKGGLARHYKLNPDHGKEESPQSSSINWPHRVALLECKGKASGKSAHQTVSPPPVTVTLINESGLAVDLEKNLLTKSRQQPYTSAEDGKIAEHQNTHLMHLGPGRPRQLKRHGQTKTTERSRYSGRFSRPGQFSSKSLNNMSAEHHNIFRRKARLKERIQQCANEDFMELAVPRFTTLVTVFEFLLMKVEQNYPGKALFPEVYREFEELHAVIKRMCQDYFSNPELNDSLEIKNPKVAESLGITSSCLEAQKIQAIDSSPVCIKTINEHVFTEIWGQKRATESSDEMLPFAKKIRAENLLENVNINSDNSEIKERCPTYEGGGVVPEQNCVGNIFSGNTLQQKEHHESLEVEVSNERADMVLHNQFMQVKLETLQLSSISKLNCSASLPSWGERLPLVSAESSQEKLVSANSTCNAASNLSVPEFCNSIASETSNQNPALSMHEENTHDEKCQEPLEEEVRTSLLT